MTMIRPVSTIDAGAVCQIYNYYVANTAITFETEAVGDAEMAHRIGEITANYPWLVAEDKQGVVGYAYATRWRARAAYDKTVETTIYLRHGAARSGIGMPLYEALIDALSERGFHALVGCITVPNPPSIAFHEKCGFVKVAHFPQVGNKFGNWVDVGFWQLTL
jgi:L-amino acid N-acyltransferase YncA